ncbi:MAG TPA: hypothetical protein VFT39_05480 [Vicinamibacterales bacterium]|nr:hypothetical protein [Vicinamibacterales bacterium]
MILQILFDRDRAVTTGEFKLMKAATGPASALLELRRTSSGEARLLGPMEEVAQKAKGKREKGEGKRHSARSGWRGDVVLFVTFSPASCSSLQLSMRLCSCRRRWRWHMERALQTALAATWALTLCACGGGPNGPAPQPSSNPPATPTNTWSIAGQVVATGSQQRVGGATITPGWSLAAVNADEQGTFGLGDRTNPPAMPAPATISQPGFISHDVWLAWQAGARGNVTLEIIRDAPPFSLDFDKQFVRDTYDHPSGPPSFLRRWEMAPSFYVRTVDQNGRPVEPEVLAVTLDALRRAVPAYTADRYAAAAIETGTDVRPHGDRLD